MQLTDIIFESEFIDRAHTLVPSVPLFSREFSATPLPSSPSLSLPRPHFFTYFLGKGCHTLSLRPLKHQCCNLAVRLCSCLQPIHIHFDENYAFDDSRVLCIREWFCNCFSNVHVVYFGLQVWIKPVRFTGFIALFSPDRSSPQKKRKSSFAND